MIRTQIQLPDPLYQRLKVIAEQQDWSLSEVMRKAAEPLDPRIRRTARLPTQRLKHDLGKTGMRRAAENQFHKRVRLFEKRCNSG
jgi:predicted transcriptional regulator